MPRKKQKGTELNRVLYILDGSGSMEWVQDDVVGGVNTFIDEQKKVGNILFSLTVFDTRVEKPYVAVPIADVKPVDRKITLLGGLTALNDAVGKTVTDAQSDDFPGKTLVVIYTDGAENASREWTVEKVKALLEEADKDDNWTVTYVSADVDNFAHAVAMGVPAGNYMTTDSANTGGTMSALATASSSYMLSDAKATRSFVKDQKLEEKIEEEVAKWSPPSSIKDPSPKSRRSTTK